MAFYFEEGSVQYVFSRRPEIETYKLFSGFWYHIYYFVCFEMTLRKTTKQKKYKHTQKTNTFVCYRPNLFLIFNQKYTTANFSEHIGRVWNSSQVFHKKIFWWWFHHFVQETFQIILPNPSLFGFRNIFAQENTTKLMSR